MKTKLSALLTLALFLPLIAIGAELSLNEKDTIYIAAVRIQPALAEKAQRAGTILALQRAAETLEAEFSNALSATRVFQLVERQELATLEKEQALTNSGIVDAENSYAAKAGRMYGARFVFIPTLTGFEDTAITKRYSASGRTEVTRNLFVAAMVKIVHTKTGALLPEAPSVQLKKSEVVPGVAAEQAGSGEELLVTQAKELARQLAQEAVIMLRPAKVLKVSGRQLLINRGSEAGFNLGDQIEIFAIENVRDEESGETYRNEIPLGQAEIIRIDKKQSFAMINGDDLGITAGGIVKIFRSATAATKSGSDVPPPAIETPGSSEKPLKWKD